MFLTIHSFRSFWVCALGARVQNCSQISRNFVTVPQAPRTSIVSAKDQVSKPASVLNKFVSYPKEEFHQYLSPFLKEEFVEQLDTFNDHSLLIRRPILDLLKDIIQIRTLQTSVENVPPESSAAPRFLAYGQPGTGISVILSQIGHFAAVNDWLVFPFPNAERWTKRCYDLTPSSEYHQAQHRSNLIGDAFDFPGRSADWLKGFLNFNKSFLEKFKPVTTREVNWSRADVAAAGTPWTDLINFAIIRPKYSTDCIGILLREMRSLCSQPDGPPCLLLIDGVNFLWCRATRLKDKTLGRRVTVDRLAIVHHLIRALRADWRHGVILTSTNIRAAWPTDREKYTPGYLLGKSGFQCLDPFVPLLVENYNKMEFDACLQFYLENNWLFNPAAKTEGGQAELEFLSDRNPLELDNLAAEW